MFFNICHMSIAPESLRLYPLNLPDHPGWGVDDESVISSSIYQYLECTDIMRLWYLSSSSFLPLLLSVYCFFYFIVPH